MMHARRLVLLAVALMLAACGLFSDANKQMAAARKSLAGGDYGAAVIVLRNLLGDSPDDADARLLLAQALFMQGHAAAAESELAAAAESGADPARVMEFRLQWQLAAGEFQAVLDASEDPQTALAIDRRSYYRARALQALRRVPEAMVIYRQLAEKQPDSPELQLRMAQCHAYHGRTTLAHEALDKALSQPVGESEAPVSAEAWVLKAALAQGADDVPAMNEAWRKALDAAPGELSAAQHGRLLMGAVDRALRAGDLAEARRLHGQLVRVLPQSPLTQMVTAQLQLFEGEPARSVRELLLLLQRQPENDAARALLVAAQLHAGALEQALKEANALGASSPEALDLERLREVIREAADLPANSVERALAVASAYLALQQPALARSLLEGAQRAHPGNKGLKAALVGAELRSGRRAQALRSAELLAQDYPGDPAVSVLLAEAQTVNGDFKGASATYEAVWRIAPSGQLALTLARTRRLAQLGDAEWPLHEWLRSHPQDASVRLNLATALQQSDSPGRAVLELERVVAGTPAGHPLRAIALNNLAWLYAESSDPRALDTARQAYEGARAAAFVQDTYGWLLARQDRLKEALPLLEAAAASAPTSAEIRYHYAAVLARSGETQKAALLLQDILQATDPFEGRQEAEQLLASL